MKPNLEAQTWKRNGKIAIATSSLLGKFKVREGQKLVIFFYQSGHKLKEQSPLKNKMTRAVSAVDANFLTATWLPQCHLWATFKGAASLT